jgi:hypothetical protein
MGNRFVWCAALAVIVCSSRAVTAQDWTQKFPVHSPAKRMYPAMAQFSNQTVLGASINVVMFGGVNLGLPGTFLNFSVLGDTWIWDDTDWTQLTISNSPPARFGASMAYFPGNDVAPPVTVLFGGKDAAGNILSDTWVFRSRTTCSFKFSCTRTFSWTQVAVDSGPPGRFAASMAFSSVGYQYAFNGTYGQGIILTGGTDGTTAFSDTWRFDAFTLTWSPDFNDFVGAYSPARSFTAVATCSGLGGAVLFGGMRASNSLTSLLGDTWHHLLYPIDTNPRWVEVNTTPEPSNRFGHGMAFYPVSNREVMYGGQGFNSFVNIATMPTDTWNANCVAGSFGADATTWAAATPAHNPGRKSFHGMTTGPNNLSVVMFGGNNLTFPQFAGGLTPNGRDTNETWTWGRRVACLPGPGSELVVGSQIDCRFDAAEGFVFNGWTAQGFAPPAGSDLTPTFHTEGPGTASITALWTEGDGTHSQTFTYSIGRPNGK